jgi:hypothetical protein
MSPGSEFDKAKMFLTQTTHSDYEQLCKLDVHAVNQRGSFGNNILHLKSLLLYKITAI